VDDRKSTFEYVFSLGTGLVTWNNKKQHVVSPKNQLTKKYIKYSNFEKNIYIHVHPYESKPLYTNMQKFFMYIASKGAYNQNSTECNTSLNQNTSTKRL
jgi:hypothetical protein